MFQIEVTIGWHVHVAGPETAERVGLAVCAEAAVEGQFNTLVQIVRRLGPKRDAGAHACVRGLGLDQGHMARVCALHVHGFTARLES